MFIIYVYFSIQEILDFEEETTTTAAPSTRNETKAFLGIIAGNDTRIGDDDDMDDDNNDVSWEEEEEEIWGDVEGNLEKRSKSVGTGNDEGEGPISISVLSMRF
jgi:hypothetical protein